MNSLIVSAIQTRIFTQKDDLVSFVINSVPRHLVNEEMVLVVTSKIVSLAEGHLLNRSKMNKEDLVRREADIFLGEIEHGCFLTIKHGMLIPSAGIDESNSENGDYILYPKDPYRSANELRINLQKYWRLKKLGVLITDSRTTPLRRGVTGICLSYAGFQAIKNMVGKKDLFGRELRMTQMNLADGIAASAVMMMGEAAESRPLAIIQNADLSFIDGIDQMETTIPIEEDLYFPLLKSLISS